MFSKAKLKRFNEEVGCAPPPTAYNPIVKDKCKVAVTIDKSERWKCTTEVTPGSGTYTTKNISPTKKQALPCRLNSSSISTCSNGSSASGSGIFLSPLKPKMHSRLSVWALRGHPKEGDSVVAELQERIKELTKERDRMKMSISQLETELEVLKATRTRRELRDTATSKDAEEFDLEERNREHCESELKLTARSTPKKEEEQLNSLSPSSRDLIANGSSKPEEELFVLKELQSTKNAFTEAQLQISALTDERSGLQLKLKQFEESADQKSLSEDEVQNMKEQINHLTVLRDNLEAAAFQKDDLIAELQVQLDELVVEGRGFQDQMEANKTKVEQLEEEIEISFKERHEAENKVRNLVARYEGLIKNQLDERDMHMEILAKKDIEIELLNGSLNNLNMKVAEYEQTLSSLQEKTSLSYNKISLLESTISDLSMMTKEKEMMESILGEELNHRTDEVGRLEQTVQEAKVKLNEVTQERDCTIATLEAEQQKAIELRERVNHLEMEIKEKEVVQQFLEKEITSREAEISNSSTKVKELERELETARQVALDLQQEAEVHLNEVLTLKATVDAKDVDIGTKGELISTLQDEITNLTKESSSMNATLSSREEKLAGVEIKISNLEDNHHQLEEQIVDLMAEISDREAQHISQVNRLESDLDDLGVKYSEALLEHEATRRVLTQTSEQLDKENLLRLASEADIKTLKEELTRYTEENKTMESNLKDLVQKYTNLEDALACEEAENRDLEDRLERELRLAEDAAAATQKELSSLQTSSDGFCTQITQLKIDMRKKSQAVEEMQQCIEALREEKVHLTTLRDNLERSVESKEETVDKLHLKVSTLEREMEEERVTLRSRIADLENHLKETEHEFGRCTRSISELEDKVSVLEEDKLKLNKSYEKQLEEKASLLTQATTKLEEVEKKYDGYEDQMKNLQTSLSKQKAEAEDFKEKYTTASRTLKSSKEEIKTLEACVNRLQLDMNSAYKTFESLNATISTNNEGMQSLYESLDEKQAAIIEYQSRLLKLEENEEKLVKEKEEACLTISNLQDALNVTKSQLSRSELTYSEEKAAEVSRITQVLEVDNQDLKNSNAALLEELNSWKNKFQHLEKMIEPFREQLDAYEVEKASLLERSSAAKEEVDKLSKQYATLLGHQNHKQKIQHVLKLKNENSQLKEEMYKLRQETERNRKTIKRFEEKMLRLSGSSSRLNDTSRLLSDKENSFHLSASAPSMSSTPLKSNNKPQRL